MCFIFIIFFVQQQTAKYSSEIYQAQSPPVNCLSWAVDLGQLSVQQSQDMMELRNLKDGGKTFIGVPSVILTFFISVILGLQMGPQQHRPRKQSMA